MHQTREGMTTTPNERKIGKIKRKDKHTRINTVYSENDFKLKEKETKTGMQSFDWRIGASRQPKLEQEIIGETQKLLQNNFINENILEREVISNKPSTTAAQMVQEEEWGQMIRIHEATPNEMKKHELSMKNSQPMIATRPIKQINGSNNQPIAAQRNVTTQHNQKYPNQEQQMLQSYSMQQMELMQKLTNAFAKQPQKQRTKKTRIHVFLNGYGYTKGKIITFREEELESFDHLITIILRKFNLLEYDSSFWRAKTLLYGEYGTEIEDIEDIETNDIIFLVKPNQVFKPPMPIPIMIQLQKQSIDLKQFMQFQETQHVIRQQSEYENFFANFCDELYLHVFSFLDHRDIGLNVAMVNRHWNRLANSDILWKNLTKNVYYYREKRNRLRLEEASKEAGKEAKPTTQTTTANPDDNQTNVTNGRSEASAVAKPEEEEKNDPPQEVKIPLEKIELLFSKLDKPPIYKSWKTFYRYYILWAMSLTWNTTERGPNIKFTNNNLTVFRNDNIHYHWQTLRGSLPIDIPTQEERRYKGIDDGCIDDTAIYEFEIEVNRFDTSSSNGWWIVFGLESENFTYKESTPTNLIGYDLHLGFGYAAGNGDSLHCYANHAFKLKQPFTCDPVNGWMQTPFGEKDVVRARLTYGTKLHTRDSIDPAEQIGATLDFYLNDKHLGQAFRNITGRVYPALSLLPNQIVTLRHVDPIAEAFRKHNL